MEHGGIDLYQMGLTDRIEAAAQLLLRCHQLQLYHKFRRRVPDDLVEPDTVNGDGATLYLISLDDYKADPAVLFSNEDEVASAVPHCGTITGLCAPRQSRIGCFAP